MFGSNEKKEAKKEAKLAKVEAKQQAAEEKASAERSVVEEQARVAGAIDNVVLTTSTIDKPHQILDIVFSASQKKFGGKGFKIQSLELMSDKEYNEMLEEVYLSSTQMLKEKAAKVGADAVIGCNFDLEQLIITETGMLAGDSEALRVQVFVTGTAVKLL
jgi:uncharacterized protein YbjQ (UPF0145 family)